MANGSRLTRRPTRSARLPVQKALLQRAQSLSAAGQPLEGWHATATARQGKNLPYVVLGSDTEAPHPSASTFEADAPNVTHTLRFYAADPTSAKVAAAAFVESVTDPDSPLGPLVVEGFALVEVRYDFGSPAPEERAPGAGLPSTYGEVIRLRFTLHS